LCHVYNNYCRNNDYGVASTCDAKVLVEGNYFQNVDDPTLVGYGSSWDGELEQRDNLFSGSGSPETRGFVSIPSYGYTLDTANSIPNIVSNDAEANGTTGDGDTGNNDSGDDDSGDSDQIAEYTYCSDEGEICTYSGTVDIAYGADGQYAYLYDQSSGSCDCNNDTFGDPIYGVKKACYIKPASATTNNIIVRARGTNGDVCGCVGNQGRKQCADAG
jgi:hypothetical protein